jgi:hypothetical protein
MDRGCSPYRTDSGRSIIAAPGQQPVWCLTEPVRGNIISPFFDTATSYRTFLQGRTLCKAF